MDSSLHEKSLLPFEQSGESGLSRARLSLSPRHGTVLLFFVRCGRVRFEY